MILVASYQITILSLTQRSGTSSHQELSAISILRLRDIWGDFIIFYKFDITFVSKVSAQITLLNLSELIWNGWDKLVFSGKFICSLIYVISKVIKFRKLHFKIGISWRYTVKTNFNSTCTMQETKTFPPPRQENSAMAAEMLFEKGKQSKISNFHNNFQLCMMSLVLKCFINEGLA